ncbi:hypothetical protein [Caproicibacterium sp. BJN0003]|uniref:hypothetical protein n=1 Tax=Caproicibacterium sp. BJN0003 TaxID=2994078 RepID=UPI0022553585|nr:hypothetical protein [Caproicibacterium sp. BJN0003]UZT82625.1 hypothetical protein OP489_02100 [Caproicibacterium sp. BJN0003]
MHYLVLFIKLTAFFLSNLGFWELLRRKTQINIYFLPSLTIAVQTTILFFAGLLNILKGTTYLLWGCGLALLIFFITNDRNVKFINNYKKVGFVYLVISAAIMLFYVRGKIFTHYDNFSHWALVVKQMLSTNRYPNFEDTIIMFQEYPLGSSTYIYYFAKLVGKNESLQMFAQIYTMLTCLLPIFTYTKKNQILSCGIMFFVTNFLFLYNINVTDLLVDTLLPLVSMCALLYVYRYSVNFAKYHIELWLSIFYMIQIIQIKNSGIFFSAIASIWILIRIRNDKAIISRLAIALLPYITLKLWQNHCSYVYASSATSKHAMTVANYKNVFASKTAEDVRTICHAMLKFSLTYKDVWFIFLCLIFAGIVCFTVAKANRQFFIKIFIFNLVMYIMYQVGTLVMYLYSMPGDEATSLSSSSRYCKTILIAIVYGTILLYLKIISDIELKRITGIISILTLVVVMFVAMKGTLGTFKTVFSDVPNASERNWIQNVKNQYGIPMGESCCIVISSSDSGYTYYLGKYIFQTNDILTLISPSKEDMDTISSKYILVYDKENTSVQGWISTNYPGQVGNEVIIRK